MKKIFLFATAAMVSLSSCVQTDEVYTGGVQEIGFKSGVTRAAVVGDKLPAGSAINVAGVWDADGVKGIISVRSIKIFIYIKQVP